MRQIIPHALWLGNVRDAEALRTGSTEIAAVVDLTCYEAPIVLSREQLYCHFPLVDGAGNEEPLLRLAIHTVALFLKEKVPTFVYCGMGMSRTPVVAASALAIALNRTPHDCLEEIARLGAIDVNPGLWQTALRAVRSEAS